MHLKSDREKKEKGSLQGQKVPKAKKQKIKIKK